MAKKDKVKVYYECAQCGKRSLSYMGRCPQCGTYNSFVEVTEQGELASDAKKNRADANANRFTTHFKKW